MAEDDNVWRRPDPTAAPESDPRRYCGPPATQAPPTDWHPPTQPVVEPARQLPAVDHDAIDAQERDAARITYGIGLAALLVLTVIACGRLV